MCLNCHKACRVGPCHFLTCFPCAPSLHGISFTRRSPRALLFGQVSQTSVVLPREAPKQARNLCILPARATPTACTAGNACPLSTLHNSTELMQSLRPL